MFITVREGPTSVRLLQDWKKLPWHTTFSGRLVFGDRRIYGRLTEARTRDGEFPVCVELVDLDLDREGGLVREPDGNPETARVFSTLKVRAVNRFE